MKKKFLLLIATSFLALISVAQVPNYVPANGLVGWWPFNGDANDISGNGNNGTVNGATTLTSDRNNLTNSAYSLPNLNDNISVNNASPAFNNNAQTISFWMKFPSQYNYSSISLITNGVHYTNGFCVAIDQNNAAYGANNYLVVYLLGAGKAVTFITNQTVLGQWSNIVSTYDGTSMKLYLNGVLKATQANSQSINSPDGNLLFADWDNPTAPSVTSRLIDDIGIWNRALTQQEILSLYSGCNNSFTTQPSNKTALTGSNTQFKAISNGSTPNYQWQSNSNNLGWTNIPTNSYYSGVTTNTLTINSIQVSNHQQKFRVIANSGACIDTSSIATLSITDTCLNVKFISVTDTLIINAKLTGISPPNNFNLVKVYPNPAKSHIIIDCGNYVSMSGYRLTIENSIGQQVFFSIITKQQYDISLTGWTGMGLYLLKINDPSNNLAEVKKIILQ